MAHDLLMTTTLQPRPASRSTSTVVAYGLSRPTVVDARAAIERVYHGADADRVWTAIVGPALGARQSALSIEEIVDAMMVSTDDVVRLCGQALKIRLRSFSHLATAHAIIR